MVSITVIHPHYQCVSISISFLWFFLFGDFCALFTCDFGLYLKYLCLKPSSNNQVIYHVQKPFSCISISFILLLLLLFLWLFDDFIHFQTLLLCVADCIRWNIFGVYFHWVKCVGLSLIEIIIDDDKKPYLINDICFRWAKVSIFIQSPSFIQPKRYLPNTRQTIQNGQLWWKRKTAKSSNHLNFSRWILDKAG